MLATPPIWFDLRADEMPPWASVRLSRETREWLVQQWAAPATYAAMARLWGSFRLSKAHFRAPLPRMGADKLARVTPWALVNFLYVALGVDQGITECIRLPMVGRKSWRPAGAARCHVVPNARATAESAAVPPPAREPRRRAGVMATAAEERTARDLRDVKGEEGA